MTRKCLNTKVVYGWNFNLKVTNLLYKQWTQISQKSTDSSSAISPRNVLSQSNKENCINLMQNTPPVYKVFNKNLKRAAVLVPLCKVDGELAFLYTVRSATLRVNAGQVAFPGGMVDKSDGSLEETALRECFEEVGIGKSQVDIWGKGPVIYRKNVLVTPILGYIGDLKQHKLIINFDEVSVVFSTTLEYLSSLQNFRTTQFRSDRYMTYKMPVYLTTPTRIWGLTALITHIMLSCLIPHHYLKSIKYKPSFYKIPHLKSS